ncbi:cellulose synthase operon protein YhjQ/BcsQ [Sabulicella rubraurantiaca]|uniref:cellulose synthase operon protein YhjQ/BcsQ n=1 Tax=Sabulicella rubraurantiaca TaxID=2811429 RepID=UPI001A95B3B9|nr:cellulose synthase operon protein YhjQ/BcsQ [Sabulicella rubraurantiaca]
MPLICFSSPKGGVGKTTLAAHLAAILAARGYETIALDLDPQNSLRLHLGIPFREEGGLFSDPPRPWRETVRGAAPRLRVLPHGALDPRRSMRLQADLLDAPERIAGPVREMLELPGTVVIVDCPPGSSGGLSALVPLADLLLVVLLADAGSAAMLPQVASGRVLGHGTLSNRLSAKLAMVLNQVALDQPLSKAVLSAAARTVGDRLIGAVAQDVNLGEALAQKRLLLDGSEGGAAEDLQMLTDAIVQRLGLTPAAPGGARRDYAALSDWGLAE